MPSSPCPLSASDRDQVYRYLHSLSSYELHAVVLQVQNLLTPSERLNYDLARYCSDYTDIEGRIGFLMALVDASVIAPVTFPRNGVYDPRTGTVTIPKASAPLHILKKEDVSKASKPALTDELVASSSSDEQLKIEIANPRWEPVAEAQEGGDPETPLMGDTVRLLADVKNYPEGAPVSFDIYDVTDATPLRIATVSGKNSGGKAAVEWKVEDPQQRGDALKIKFEAGAKSKYTEKAELPWQAMLQCDFVEMPDVLFHHNSAVPCLDSEGMLVGAAVAAFVFSKENPDKEVVIFGHADTSGDPAYNYDLSEWRAEGIRALLDNDSHLWLDVVDLASKVEDYQAILKSLASGHGWSCDPGEVDNANGPKTKDAIKAFQETYNEKFKGDLKVDGCIGPKTWTALFTVMRSVIADAIGEPDLPKLSYGYGGKGIYPCGESFPIDSAEKDGYKSSANRRVEIVFYDKGKAPELKPPADKKKVEKKEAPVYDEKKTEKKPVPVKPSQPVSGDNLVLEFVFPQVHDSSKPHKQYVNLDANGKEQGLELAIKVKTKDINASTDGKRVYWRVTADAKNSKRTDPKTGIMEKTGGKLIEFTAGVANLDTAFNGKESSAVLACGLAGGDRFTVEVGTDGNNFTSSLIVENWRKLWYEVVMPKPDGNDQVSDFTVFSVDKTPKLSPGTVQYMNNVLKKSFIEFDQSDGTLYQMTDLPQNGKYNIFDGSYFDNGYGRNIVAMTLDQAADVLQKRAKHISNQRTVSVIFSDYLLQSIEWKKTYSNICMPASLNTDFKVFKDAVDDYNTFSRGEYTITKMKWKVTHWWDASPSVSNWRPISSPNDPGWNYQVSGVITDKDELKAHLTFETFEKISIDFPDDKNHYPGKIIPKDHIGQFVDNGCALGMTLYFEGLAYKANINGAALSGTIWMNTFAGAVADEGVGGVILHELGHNMGQVYADKSVDTTFGRSVGKGIPGIPFPKSVPDGLTYGGHSHQGTHCASGLSMLTRGLPSFQVAPASNEHDCVMFGASSLFDSKDYYFCDECTTYIKAEDISNIRKSWTV